MSHQTSATTTRDVEVTRIPSGERITLATGTEVLITQALGGSFTILVPSQAGLYRIEGQDADAIGQEATSGSERPAEGDLEQAAWNQLKTCYDPEIPVNIVDLGLVYLCELNDAEEGGTDVKIKMTLTAPGCGMGPVLANDVKSKVESLPGVKRADVEVVFDPVWDRSMMSDAAKLQLGMMW